MKKTFVVISSVLLIMFVFSCAKKNSNTSSSASTPLPVNNNTSFSVDGVPANQPNSAGTANNSTSTYVVSAIDNTGYPQITIAFNHPIEPTSGTFSIVTGSIVLSSRCNFLLTQAGNYTATASSGTVVINTVSTHSYEVVFNGITCTGSAGTHVVSGTIGY